MQRSLVGQPVRQIGEILPCPVALTQIEKGAWLQLQNWSTDEPLRVDSHLHAEYSRKRLNYFLDALQ